MLPNSHCLHNMKMFRANEVVTYLIFVVIREPHSLLSICQKKWVFEMRLSFGWLSYIISLLFTVALLGWQTFSCWLKVGYQEWAAHSVVSSVGCGREIISTVEGGSGSVNGKRKLKCVRGTFQSKGTEEGYIYIGCCYTLRSPDFI
jgi:hypothetical protein